MAYRLPLDTPCKDCGVNPRLYRTNRMWPYCKPCHNARTKKWQLDNPEAFAAAKARRYEKVCAERESKPKRIPVRKQQIYNMLNFYAMNPDLNECQEWEGARKGQGYGLIQWEGKCQLVTRVVLKLWMEQNGQTWDENLDVLHSCDNPACYWIGHLRQGTPKENIQDAIERGRFYVHNLPKTWLRKLTDNQVREVRRRLAEGEAQHRIAALLNVSEAVISQINTGRTYKDIL